MRAISTSKGIVYMFSTKAEFDLIVRDTDTQTCFIAETLEWYKGRKPISDPKPLRSNELNTIIEASNEKKDPKKNKSSKKKR